MARILIAASHEPRLILERILAGHELSFAETMAQAERLLREQSLDLIICTIVFDDSKMFDLLRLVKSTADWRRISFVGVRIRPHILKHAAVRAAAFTCGALGAAAFLDIDDYKVEPEREMGEAIEQLLETTSRGGS
jgi:CheY-like chemotaxis protein